MKRPLACALVGAVVVFLMSQHDLYAQDPLEADLDETGAAERDWGIALTPYILFASQSTDVGSQQIRQSFNDLATLTDFGLQARLTVRYKRLLFAADGTYANLETVAEALRSTIAMNIQQRILDMKLFWPVYDSRTPENDGGVGVWVGAGARYWSNDIFLEVVTEPLLPSGQPTTDTIAEVQDWWDPELGLALHFPVTPAIGFSVRASGGGFGIGDASTFMWDAEFTALFRVSRRFLVSAGYRQFRYTRTDGEGDEAVETKVNVVGPQIGFSFGIF
jgi:hypothetical protein